RPGPGATVGDGAAPGVGERETPSVASAGGEGAGEIVGVARVEWPVTAGVAGCIGQTEPRGQRHREVHGSAEAGGWVHGSAEGGGWVHGSGEGGGWVHGSAEAGGWVHGSAEPGNMVRRPAEAREVVRGPR